MDQGQRRMKILTDLHDLWESLTGQELKRLPDIERLFWEFNNAGFTGDELRSIVTYMQRCNAKGGGRYKIQVHKVIGDLTITASILAEVKAKERNTRQSKTASEKIMAAYEKPVDPEQADSRIKGTGRHVSEIFRNLPSQ